MGDPMFRMGMGILEGATPQATPPNAIRNMMGGLQGASDYRNNETNRMLQRQKHKMDLERMEREKIEHEHKLKMRNREEDQFAALTDISGGEDQLAALTNASGLDPFASQIPTPPVEGMDGVVPLGDLSAVGGVDNSPQTAGVAAPQNTGALSPYAQSIVAPLIQQERILQTKLQNPLSPQDYLTTQNGLIKLKQDKAKAQNLIGIGEKLPPGEREMFYQDPKTYMTNRMTSSGAVLNEKLAEKNAGPFTEKRLINGIEYEVSGTRGLDGQEQIYSAVPRPQPAEVVGKIQQMIAARTAYYGMENPETGEMEGGARDFVYKEDGSVDRQTLLGTLAPMNFQYGRSRSLTIRMQPAIQAITRIETGAAMPASEVRNTMIRFMPDARDSDQDVAIKLMMMEDFINGSLRLLDKSEMQIVGEGDKAVAEGVKIDDAKFEREINRRKKMLMPSGSDPYDVRDSDQGVRS